MPLASMRMVLAYACMFGAAAWKLEPCHHLFQGTPLTTPVEVPTESEFVSALRTLDVDALKADMTKLLTESNPCWPADYGNYVGLFSRLSWHAGGTFREADNVGGTGGGRQRFDPEASWPDNTNLDKARALLAPLKEKYGVGLSWGDLIALAGTHAMWHQGMPFKQFCFGRLDDADGNKSLPLGPSAEQEQLAPCTGEQGDCQARSNETNLAPTTIGLIYVNPQGPMGNPDPAESAKEIRLVFGKMGHDDRATVALVGGGHAFGRTHGACSDQTRPEGLPPNEARVANVFPWEGKCSAGTFTSGFDGAWTTTPTRWSNEFFTMMLDGVEWEKHTGPGGATQWRLKGNPSDARMRLTADLALVADPAYKAWVELFASNITALEEAFDEAWEALMTNGGGWVSSESDKRCVAFGPPPQNPQSPDEMLNTDPDPMFQPCQHLYQGTPLTTPVAVPSEAEFVTAMELLDVDALKADMTKLLTESNPCWPADYGNYVGLFSRLSWHAGGTFREADNVGGTGGGRQRFDPEASWPDNTNLDKARALLAPLKEKYGVGLSWGDLIALAGTHAMWHQGMPFKQFCFGRLDDADGNKSLPLGPSAEQEQLAPCTGEQGDCQARSNETNLAPTTIGLIYVNPQGPMGNPDPAESAKEIRLVFGKMGHDDRATVALVGGGHAFGRTHGACSDQTRPEGLPPNEARVANVFPWEGKCSAGTFTSGFDGAWTTTPTRWSNEFFTMMLDGVEWEKHTGPGGATQWRLKGNPSDPRMRLTADLALVADPAYKAWVELFASNITALEEAFDEAWEALMTNGGGWVSSPRRCVPFGPPPSLSSPDLSLAQQHVPATGTIASIVALMFAAALGNFDR